MITTHVLDTSSGKPAAGIKVSLEALSAPEGWKQIGWGTTDRDGRVRELLPEGKRLDERRYRLVFDTASYFAEKNVAAFYPVVIVVFDVQHPNQNHHVPLLLSPFGYSTYRGS
ncbi:MAG TPA: hydroxyisourate hydrolase [Gemmatimonadales bacterium]|jgi:hydroxyisourate hydrolase